MNFLEGIVRKKPSPKNCGNSMEEVQDVFVSLTLEHSMVMLNIGMRLYDVSGSV
jgi:hypothetical protein